MGHACHRSRGFSALAAETTGETITGNPDWPLSMLVSHCSDLGECAAVDIMGLREIRTDGGMD